MYLCIDTPIPPADVGSQLIPCDGNHGGRHRRVSGQPVRVVITRSIAAVTFRVTEKEGHRGKTRETASHGAWETVWTIRGFYDAESTQYYWAWMISCSYQGPGRELFHFRWWRGRSNQSTLSWCLQGSQGHECSDCAGLSGNYQHNMHNLCLATLEDPCGLHLQVCLVDLQQKKHIINGGGGGYYVCIYTIWSTKSYD